MKSFASFPDLGEFRFVSGLLDNSIELPCDIPLKRSWLHAGDDAAQFDGWLVTKDLSVEGTHFRLDWSSPEEAVEKNIVSNVSDISAMGGKPQIALLGLCLNKNWTENEKNRVAEAFKKGLAKRGIALIGGDTVTGSIGVFSLTLLGTPQEHVLCRNGASVGENIFVVGSLGKSAAGLWVLENCPEEKTRFQRLVDYHLSPKIIENAGTELVKVGVRGACIDISDGLSSELTHLAKSSQVGMQIFENKLPIDSEVLEMAAFFGLNPLNFALNGGEEYQLLFTSSLDEVIFNKNGSFSVTCIGSVIEGNAVLIQNEKGNRILEAGAYTHL